MTRPVLHGSPEMLAERDPRLPGVRLHRTSCTTSPAPYDEETLDRFANEVRPLVS